MWPLSTHSLQKFQTLKMIFITFFKHASKHYKMKIFYTKYFQCKIFYFETKEALIIGSQILSLYTKANSYLLTIEEKLNSNLNLNPEFKFQIPIDISTNG